MKKILLFLILLFVGVFCSACINNFAVYELNNKALELIKANDYESAIGRLESSVDLDNSRYDTRYNLAVAYIRTGNCEKALEHALAGDKISPNQPLMSYNLGLIYECVADNTIKEKNEEGELVDKKFSAKTHEIEAKNLYIEYLGKANIEFDKYVTQLPNADDTKDILGRIEANKTRINEINTEINSEE